MNVRFGKRRFTALYIYFGLEEGAQIDVEVTVRDFGYDEAKRKPDHDRGN